MGGRGGGRADGQTGGLGLRAGTRTGGRADGGGHARRMSGRRQTLGGQVDKRTGAPSGRANRRTTNFRR